MNAVLRVAALAGMMAVACSQGLPEPVPPLLECSLDPSVSAKPIRGGPLTDPAPGLPAGAVFNAYEQYQWLTSTHRWQFGCNGFIGYAQPDCSRYALVQGVFSGAAFYYLDPPGVIHDGDFGNDLWPTSMTAVDLTGEKPATPVELRTDEWNDGRLHLEWKWCRHYFGPISLAALHDDTGLVTYPPGDLPSNFEPELNDVATLLGEWVMDVGPKGVTNATAPERGKAEMHEVWVYAVRPPDPGWDMTMARAAGYGHPLDIRVSAQFQQNQVVKIDVPIPQRSADDSSLKSFECVRVPAESGGCTERPGVQVTVAPNYTNAMDHRTFPNPGGIVKISITPPTDGMNPYNCEFGSCSDMHCLNCSGGVCDKKPPSCPNAVRDQDGNQNGCNVTGGHPAFSGVVRCYWRDPQDLWECDDCACRNGADLTQTMRAPVVGCASAGLDPSNPLDRSHACEQVCGGLVCGSAPSCRIDSCFATAPSHESARLLAKEACTPPPPFDRVTPAADYRVELTAGSRLRFGKVNAIGDFASFAEVAHTTATGNVTSTSAVARTQPRRKSSSRKSSSWGSHSHSPRWFHSRRSCGPVTSRTKALCCCVERAEATGQAASTRSTRVVSCSR